LFISADVIERNFEWKHCAREGHQGGPILYDNAPGCQKHAIQKKLDWPGLTWPTWPSIFLITHLILRIWPRRTKICSLD
jgi:hypothetical protein